MTKGIFRIFNPAGWWTGLLRTSVTILWRGSNSLNSAKGRPRWQAARSAAPGSKASYQTRLPPLTTKSDRAARSYRDRRVWYTRCLEKDLQRTRAREAKLLQECEHLRVTVRNVLSVLDELGVELPSDPRIANTTQSLPVHGSGDDSPRSPERLPIPLMTGIHSNSEASTPFGGDRYPASTLSSTPLKPPTPLAGQPLEGPPVAAERWPTPQDLSQASISPDDRACLGDLDVVTLGMEFVLKYGTLAWRKHPLSFVRQMTYIWEQDRGAMSGPHPRQSRKARWAERPCAYNLRATAGEFPRSYLHAGRCASGALAVSRCPRGTFRTPSEPCAGFVYLWRGNAHSGMESDQVPPGLPRSRCARYIHLGGQAEGGS